MADTPENIQRSTDTPLVVTKQPWGVSTGVSSRIYRRIRWAESTAAITHPLDNPPSSRFIDTGPGVESTQHYAFAGGASPEYLQMYFYWLPDPGGPDNFGEGNPAAGNMGTSLPPERSGPYDDQNHPYAYGPGAQVYRSGIYITGQTQAFLRLNYYADPLLNDPVVDFSLWTDWDVSGDVYQAPDTNGQSARQVGVTQEIIFPDTTGLGVTPAGTNRAWVTVRWDETNGLDFTALTSSLSGNEHDYLRVLCVTKSISGGGGKPPGPDETPV